jgi:hypothetical protein
METLTTLNTGDITYNDNTWNIKKFKITHIFLVESFISKIS